MRSAPPSAGNATSTDDPRLRTRVGAATHGDQTQMANILSRLGLTAAFALSFAPAAMADIALPGDMTFPESIGSTSDGTLFVGSPGAGGVIRVQPGQKPEQFIKPAAFGTRSLFGVLADEKAGVLYVCSNDLTALGAPGPSKVEGAYLKAFDLKTGEGKASYKLPGAHDVCNDMTVAADGGLLVTNTFGPQIYRLAPGGKALEVWAEDSQFTPPAKGAGLDGIVIGGDGNVYTNTFTEGKMFRVEVKDGKAGKVTQLKPSRPTKLTDAMRDADGSSFLMIEGSGNLDRVTIDGDTAKLDTLKDGIDGPTGVTKVGDKAYVTEGQLTHLFGGAGGKGQHLPFKVYEVPLK